MGQCAHLKKGVLLVNGSVKGCSRSVVAGVRGTTYIMEVDENEDTTLKVLEGEITVSKVENPDNIEEPLPDTDAEPPILAIG